MVHAAQPRAEVRRAVAAELGAISSMLARSFADDPVFEYLMPNTTRRDGGLEAYFGIQLRRDYLPFGGAWTTPGTTGAALWSPPGKPLRTGVAAIVPILPLVRFTRTRGAVRAVALLDQIESLHPSQPHWYLGVLGTDPPFQGHGVGSALLEPVLQRCDEDGVGAYLESSKEKNLAFYANRGFEVTNEIVRRGGPSVWTMWRPPVAPGR